MDSADFSVLVVEDEPLLRMNAVTVIEDAGYTVVEASDADQAIALMNQNRAIRVLFTDIEMPGSMNGLKLAHAVRERWPHVVLIVASGRVRPLIDEMPPDTIFLPKPYSAAAIVDAVKRAA